MQSVLKVEFGGMNDVLTRLHLVSGDPAHLRAARGGRLPGRHPQTGVPEHLAGREPA
jgi:hypothetical protein